MTVDSAYRERLRQNIEQVRQRIADAAVRAGRNPDEITLVAISKTHGVEECTAAVELGLGILGENRVQEARDKIPRVAEFLSQNEVSQPEWHLVGHLQSNKAGKAVALFQLIQSLDDYELAVEINRHAQVAGTVQDCLLEVNTSGEASKFGVNPTDLPGLWEKTSVLTNIRLLGFMTVGPLGGGELSTRRAFALLRELSVKVRSSNSEGAGILSMGMTGDMEWAIAEGSTMLRIGTAIFGERQH